MKSQISTRRFTQLFSATPRGARLARLLAERQIEEWGWPPSCEASESAVLVVAELAANAVVHGRVPGRGFRLTLTAGAGETLRIEVVDPRGERGLPAAARRPDALAEHGRGLLLVERLTDRWGSGPWPPSGKLVWAEIDCPHEHARW
ncbi:ATP-binding protein [Streptomyces sp. V3I7]|uniref:ATP-binding protein n=1 Tax=Streptomyces sp. V3I7 TaxID=3042278 RepID=UPI00277E5EB9|nr:ATP-binding protein [Streptomyces sp. V3I7]MDQ0990574.1 anti-sigma regulatory factor (Ser/Thr protein kinase) [Streptomyces sp. V3I7]